MECYKANKIGSEFLIEKEQEMRIVQVVNNSVTSTEKIKLEQKFKKDLTLTSLAAPGEKNDSSCCGEVLLTSTGVTLEWYPNILGVYSLQTRGGPPLYRRRDSEKFLYRPRRGKGRHFTWGVSSSPQQTWGWLKSFLPGKCPDLLKKWAAFDPVNKKMTADPTLTVSCRQP